MQTGASDSTNKAPNTPMTAATASTPIKDNLQMAITGELAPDNIRNLFIGWSKGKLKQIMLYSRYGREIQTLLKDTKHREKHKQTDEGTDPTTQNVTWKSQVGDYDQTL